MTRLAAVNIILRAVGLSGVSALDTNGASEAGRAERTLDEVAHEIQSMGWHYNTFRDTLEPEESGPNEGKIMVPAGTVRIDTIGRDQRIDVTQRDDHLFNLKDNTDEFDAPLKVEYVQTLVWDNIPPPIRTYIARQAAEEHNDRYGHPSRTGKLMLKTREAKAEALRFNDNVADVNVLRTNDAHRVRGQRIRQW